MLADSFRFTQSNLQDYLTCPRQFYLRYIRRMSWPAVETAPVLEAERRMQLGNDFHHLIQQHLLGVPAADLSAATDHTPELAAMWQNYLAHRPAELARPGDLQLYPEVTLSTVLSGWRLAAKYDLAAIFPDEAPARALIIDWKTNTHRPQSAVLREQIQTRVYPFVFSLAGYSLAGQAVLPEQITMQYWFALQPAQPEVLAYSPAQFERDRLYLTDLIERITTATEFPLTAAEKACRFCVYRSYCERGTEAGLLDDLADDEASPDDLDLDWEQISEIAY